MGIVLINREAIYGALFTQLQTAGTAFKTYTRRWKSIWDDPAARLALLPLLVQWETDEEVNYVQERGMGVRVFPVKVLIYSKIPAPLTSPTAGPDKTTPGSSILNPLLDALEAALAPAPMEQFLTLGGLVYDCRMEGRIVKALGDEDPSGIVGAIVPVLLLIP